MQGANAQASASKPFVEQTSAQQSHDGKSESPASGARDIPFKRDEGGGIGAGTAAATAACLLLLGIWVSLQMRSRQAQGNTPHKRLRMAWLGRFVRPAGERSLLVLESAPLTAHARLHVVAWGGKQYLIATSAETVHVLDRAGPSAAETGGERE